MKPGCQEWDEQVLATCMYAHDIEEVLKLRLPERGGDDFIAWHYEKTGIFTVKSAYMLSLKDEHKTWWEQGSSVRSDGFRSIYKEVWNAKVPQKIRIFAWKLAKEGLASQVNQRSHTLVKTGMCTICGKEDETRYHAVVRCSKAKALRWELRKHWVLPGEDQIGLLRRGRLVVSMLSRLDTEMKAKVLMLFWRAWHLRNDMIHGDGRGSVVGSALFLVSYIESLLLAETDVQGDFGNKGKGLVQVSSHRSRVTQQRSRTTKNGCSVEASSHRGGSS
jgi:hypothetical protein